MHFFVLLEAKNFCFVTKKLFKIFLYLCIYFVLKKRNWFYKTFITQEWLVVETCPTPRLTCFLMLYRLVYNICSHIISIHRSFQLTNFGLPEVPNIYMNKKPVRVCVAQWQLNKNNFVILLILTHVCEWWNSERL